MGDISISHVSSVLGIVLKWNSLNILIIEPVEDARNIEISSTQQQHYRHHQQQQQHSRSNSKVLCEILGMSVHEIQEILIEF